MSKAWLIYDLIRWNSDWLPFPCASGDQQATSPATAVNAGLHVVWGAGWQSGKLLQSFVCHPEHSAEEQGSRAARAGKVYNSITALLQSCYSYWSLWLCMLYMICTLGPRDAGSASCASAKHHRRTGERCTIELHRQDVHCVQFTNSAHIRFFSIIHLLPSHTHL